LKELANSLIENLDEGAMCLIFGSASEDFDKARDIDLLIIGKTDETKIKKISSRLNKELHIISVPKISKVSKTLKEEIIKKHLIIQGSESIVRWMVW
jgi:predicted nucleotidyltransferase